MINRRRPSQRILRTQVFDGRCCPEDGKDEDGKVINHHGQHHAGIHGGEIHHGTASVTIACNAAQMKRRSACGCSDAKARALA